MSEHENGKPEPTSPRNVAADAFVSLILLASAFLAETIKGKIPTGVPLAVSVILVVSEITMLVYFVVVLVRALGYALSEIEKVHASLEGNRAWEVSINSFRTTATLLRGAFPTVSDVRRTLRLAFRFMLVVGFVGVGVVALSIFEPVPATDAPDVKAPGAVSSTLPDDRGADKPPSGHAPPARGLSSTFVQSPLAEPSPRGDNQNARPVSREELERERDELNRRRVEVDRLLRETQEPAYREHFSDRYRERVRRSPRRGHARRALILPDRGPAERLSDSPAPAEVERRLLDPAMDNARPEIFASEPFAPGGRVSRLLSFISDFAEHAGGYWAILLLGAAAAVLGTLLLSLYTQAIRRSAGYE